MRSVSLIFLGAIFCLVVHAQQDSHKNDGVTKQGWSFGALPVVAYNTDLGFQYGALVNFYDFGNGSNYPDYNQSFYFEWSRTTKGSGINQLIYDTKVLIPHTRLIAELSYKTEQALDFYGFNGYSSYYNPDYEDDEHKDYLSRMFYRIDRKNFLLKSDFQINMIDTKIRALIGFSYLNTQIGKVDIDKLNKGKSDADKLPTHREQPGLYQYYVDAGIIPENEKNGGVNVTVKFGGILDTRDSEANPNKGTWTEAYVVANPGVDGTAYGKLIMTFRHYKAIVPRRINFAWRVSYQPKIWGEIPWYIRPYIYDSRQNRNGLGGVKSMRGILRNRIVGDGVAFANFEFRSILFRTVIKKQNFYLGLVPFADMGMVTQKTEVDYASLTTDVRQLIQPLTDDEKLHTSLGAELKFVLNDNFIVSTSYGKAMDKRDGNSGFYIDLNYMF